MIKRAHFSTIKERLGKFPAVAILGPRQCGKTTLARSFPGEYFDLEQESDRLRLDLDWKTLVDGGKLVILDEAQTWPAVFPRLRGAIDNDRQRRGRFLLLGSISPAMADLASLEKAASMINASRCFLISQTPRSAGEKTRLSCSLPEFLDQLPA